MRKTVLTTLFLSIPALAIAQAAVAPPMPAPPKYDVPPKILGDSCPELIYPQDALNQRQEGAVTIGLGVSKEGVPEGSWIAVSSGSGSLDIQALHVFQKCKFIPALLNGQPTYGSAFVKYVWKIPK